jgi:biotin carboxylase
MSEAGGSLLLVGAGLMGRGYVMAARELGLAVTLVESSARVGDYRDVVEDVALTHGSSDQHWVQAALRAVESRSPSAAVAFAEPHVLGAAWVQDRLGLPGPSLGAAVASRDKALQRLLLQNTDVPQPEFALADNVAEAAAFASTRYPVVVKALRSAGSMGVTLVEDEAHLRQLTWAERVLVEEYVDGPEYSVEALVGDGQVLFSNCTKKITSGPPEFVELGHILPVAMPAGMDVALAGIISGLGIVTGIVHAEFRVLDGRPYVIETAVRMPGDHIMELLQLAYGQDMFAQVIRLATGCQPEAAVGDGGVVAIRYLRPEPGTVLRLDGADESARLPGVVRVQFDECQPGMRIPPLRSSLDRTGYAVIRAADERELHDRIGAFLDTARVVTG